MSADPLPARQAVLIGFFGVAAFLAIWFALRYEAVEDNRTAFDRYRNRWRDRK